MGHHIPQMKETLKSVHGWGLQVLWIIILVDKQISNSIDTKNFKNYKTLRWILKCMKSNKTCSLECTLTNTTPLKIWHQHTKRKKIDLQATNKE
jgi:hypothetical protein